MSSIGDFLVVDKIDGFGIPVRYKTVSGFSVDKITTVASSSSSAGFNLPHGTAPSSPVNGDLWTTVNGLYARINSVTYGPFTQASATAPINVTKSAASAGSSAFVARYDHKHDVSTAAASGLTFSSTNTEGSAVSLARSDHTHAITAPGASNGSGLFLENGSMIFDEWIRQRRNLMRGFWEFETGGAQDANGTIYGTPFKAVSSGAATVSSASRFTNTNANSCVIIANSASGYAGFYSDHSSNAVGIPFTLGIAVVEFGITLQGGLSSFGQEYRNMFGCIDVATGVPVYGVWFEYDRVTAGHFWRICARNGGATTKTTTSAAVVNATPYRLRFEVTNSSNVNFYVNGTFVGSVTTNIPSVGNLGASMFRISGTNNLFTDIDYVAYQVALSTPRAASTR